MKNEIIVAKHVYVACSFTLWDPTPPPFYSHGSWSSPPVHCIWLSSLVEFARHHVSLGLNLISEAQQRHSGMLAWQLEMGQGMQYSKDNADMVSFYFSLIRVISYYQTPGWSQGHRIKEMKGWSSEKIKQIVRPLAKLKSWEKKFRLINLRRKVRYSNVPWGNLETHVYFKICILQHTSDLMEGNGEVGALISG